MEYKPHAYQTHSKDFILANPYCGLFLDMGLGKTVTTLTAINELIYDRFEVEKVLIIAPLRVAEHTWATEVAKWDHLSHLRIAKVLGKEKDRKYALREKADLFIINRENVPWLIGYLGGTFPFDMVVIDELSSFKNPTALRFKALRQARPQMLRVVGLTGTPSPNGLIDLWTQLYLLDRGERLEKTITAYRNKYFCVGASNGHVVFNYKALRDSEAQIYDKIGDICISMKSEDYLDLPGRIDNIVHVVFDAKTEARYKQFEKDRILELMDGEEITAVNAAALTNKLLQFSNGAVYSVDKNYEVMHDLKMDALEEIIEAVNGQPVLIFYSFLHDQERIMKRLKKYNPESLDKKDASTQIDRWNKGEIPILILHPASAGHGLNLQAGGHTIIWFGLNWSLELYQQANARLHRQGQDKAVIIHHLITTGTMDTDVMKALEGKTAGQEALMRAVKARIAEYIKN